MAKFLKNCKMAILANLLQNETLGVDGTHFAFHLTFMRKVAEKGKNVHAEKLRKLRKCGNCGNKLPPFWCWMNIGRNYFHLGLFVPHSEGFFFGVRVIVSWRCMKHTNAGHALVAIPSAASCTEMAAADACPWQACLPL